MPPRSLSDFEGAWRFDREVTPFDGSPAATAAGDASLVPVAGGLLYSETAVLRIGSNPPVRGERRYLWRAGDGVIHIAFEDGRPFHDLVLSAEAPQAGHWCDPDQYDVAYDFTAWPDWQAVWRVRGPRKDYRMRTRYFR